MEISMTNTKSNLRFILYTSRTWSSELLSKSLVVLFQFLHPFLDRRQRVLYLVLGETGSDVLRTILVERLNPNHEYPLDHRLVSRNAHPLGPLVRFLPFQDLCSPENLQKRACLSDCWFRIESGSSGRSAHQVLRRTPRCSQQSFSAPGHL